MSRSSPPIPVGTAANFWEFSCGVELDSFDGYFPYTNSRGIYPNRGDWYLYFYTEHHGRHIFKIEKEKLLSTVDELYVLLDKQVTESRQERTDKNDLAEKNQNRVRCNALRLLVNSNNDYFLDSLVSAVREDPNTAQDLESVNVQLERAAIFWKSIVFECIFLPFWWIYTFHGGFLGKYFGSRLIRLASSPLLLLVPHFMGYSPYLFSSGGSGGVLYPLFAMLMYLPFLALTGFISGIYEIVRRIDTAIFQVIPRPLTAISQAPFDAQAMSFSGYASPTVLIVYLLTVLTAGIIVKRLS